MKRITECPRCGDKKELELDEDAYDAWQNGKLIQYCFPYLSPDDRERLRSGLCPKCWDNMFNMDFEEKGWENEKSI